MALCRYVVLVDDKRNLIIFKADYENNVSLTKRLSSRLHLIADFEKSIIFLLKSQVFLLYLLGWKGCENIPANPIVCPNHAFKYSSSLPLTIQ
jgi:hypothetical protein